MMTWEMYQVKSLLFLVRMNVPLSRVYERVLIIQSSFGLVLRHGRGGCDITDCHM
jgi:hypothetical protein